MVALASAQGMKVRVVTNGSPRFRRLLSSGAIGPHSQSLVNGIHRPVEDPLIYLSLFRWQLK